MTNRFARAAAAAASTAALGAAALGVGAATQPPVPATHVVAAPAEFEVCRECGRVLGSQELLDHVRTQHALEFFSTVDDGRTDPMAGRK